MYYDGDGGGVPYYVDISDRRLTAGLSFVSGCSEASFRHGGLVCLCSSSLFSPEILQRPSKLWICFHAIAAAFGNWME